MDALDLGPSGGRRDIPLSDDMAVRAVRVRALDGRAIDVELKPAGPDLAFAEEIVVTVDTAALAVASGSEVKPLVVRVEDEEGRPIGGAEVRVLGTTVAGVTEDHGRLELLVSRADLFVEVRLFDESTVVEVPAHVGDFDVVLANLEPGAIDVTPRLPSEQAFVTSGEFSQDLGASGTPLFTPDRSVEESSALVVVRLEEPAISPPLRPADLELYSEDRSFEAAADTGAALPDRQASHLPPEPAKPVVASSKLDVRRLLRGETAVPRPAATSRFKVPAKRFEELFARELTDRSDLYDIALDTLSVARRRPVRGADPIRWFDPASRQESSTIVRGHLVRFVQRWRADGYSFGRLLHSLALAPGQAKSIAVVDWRRDETGSKSDSVMTRDTLIAEIDRSRTVTEDVDSVLRETLSGTSSSFSVGGGLAGGGGATGAPGGTGASGSGGIGIGVGYATASAEQDSYRSLAASMQQGLRDRTAQAATAVREQRTTVVRTVSQTERSQAVTEVIANHNRNHAMTVLYFEVLRHLVVSTEVAEVTPCLFVPLPTVPFTAESALAHRARLEPITDPQYRGGYDAARRLLLPPAPPAPLRVIRGSFELATIASSPKEADEDEPQQEPDDAETPPYARLELRAVLTDGRRSLPMDVDLASEHLGDRRWLFAFQSMSDSAIPVNGIRSLEIRFLDRAPSASGPFRIAELEVSGAGEDGEVSLARSVGTTALRNARVVTPIVVPRTPTTEAEDALAVRELLGHLNQQRIRFHKAIWAGFDRDELFAMLDERLMPGDRSTSRSLASVVRPEPVAFIGNSMVFPVVPGVDMDGIGGNDLIDRYRVAIAEQRVTLPTGGVFAEAVLGTSEAAEKIDDSRFWKWDEHPLDLPSELQPVSLDSRASDMHLDITPAGPSLISMQQPSAAPDPSGLAPALAAIARGDAFRDVTAVDRVTQNSIDALRQAVQTAQALGEKAGENATTAFSKYTEAQTQRHQAEATQRDIATLEQARRSGLVDGPTAGRIAERILTRGTGTSDSGSAGSGTGTAGSAAPNSDGGSGGATGSTGGGSPSTTPSDSSAIPSASGAAPAPAGSASDARPRRRSTHRPRPRTVPTQTTPRGDPGEHPGTDEPWAATVKAVGAATDLYASSDTGPRFIGRLQWRLALATTPSGVLFPLRSSWRVLEITPVWGRTLKFEAQYEYRSWLEGEGPSASHLHRSEFTAVVHGKEVEVASSLGASFAVPGTGLSLEWSSSRTHADSRSGTFRVALTATSLRSIAQGDEPARTQILTQWDRSDFQQIEAGQLSVDRTHIDGGSGTIHVMNLAPVLDPR
ncbi:hypothetical protein [Agromyces sp. C10]|uniref:hypothetical protein n=1 Tax=Agromyces sp. C10 TaxID=2935077 RepID=UPI00200B66AD|nr:hypothetical protein [Agromyces sp. C10]MCK8607921.1 hypothetical protein [Agromyces sp. C10]